MSRGNDALERIARAVEGAGGDDDVRATTFVRGLALGALVGAAIAGSTIWQRRHRLIVVSSPGANSTDAVSPQASEPSLAGEQDDDQGDRRR